MTARSDFASGTRDVSPEQPSAGRRGNAPTTSQQALIEQRDRNSTARSLQKLRPGSCGVKAAACKDSDPRGPVSAALSLTAEAAMCIDPCLVTAVPAQASGGGLPKLLPWQNLAWMCSGAHRLSLCRGRTGVETQCLNSKPKPLPLMCSAAHRLSPCRGRRLVLAQRAICRENPLCTR